MKRHVTANEAKANFLALLDNVERGEEIEITRHGKTIARLSPARTARPPAGWLKGVAVTAVPEDDLFSTGETWDIMHDDSPA